MSFVRGGATADTEGRRFGRHAAQMERKAEPVVAGGEKNFVLKKRYLILKI